MDKKVERIINLYNRLAEGEVLNKADEATRFEVNERSIQRDLADIRAYLANDPESNKENEMEYKGYIGSVELSEADQILFGKVQGIRSLISYEGTTVSELINDFHGAVDDYLALCAEEGITPEKAFKGSFNVRFKNPDLHRRAAVYAYNHSISLNSVVEESVAEYLVARKG